MPRGAQELKYWLEESSAIEAAAYYALLKKELSEITQYHLGDQSKMYEPPHYWQSSNTRKYTKEDCRKEYTYAELDRKAGQYANTAADSKHWFTKKVRETKYDGPIFYCFLRNLNLPLEVWEEGHFSSKQTQSSIPDSITIHHVKSERIQIYEFADWEKEHLEKYGDFVLYLRPISEVKTYYKGTEIPFQEKTTIYAAHITLSTIQNLDFILESPET